MEHYSMEKWIDFARDVMGAHEKAAMQSHLESGCQRCSKVLNPWRHVHAIARHDTAFEPPESTVQSIKGAFSIHGPRKATSSSRAMVEVLFDSARTPLFAGVRSQASAARQLLFGAGNYRIDIRVEPQPNSDKISLIGQVLRTTDPSAGLAAIPVVLIKGRKVMAETSTSQFGEFQAECALKGRFDLWLRLPYEELRLPITEPFQKADADRLHAISSAALSKRSRRRKIRTRKKV
jgi:hypothetical protein